MHILQIFFCVFLSGFSLLIFMKKEVWIRKIYNKQKTKEKADPPTGSTSSQGSRLDLGLKKKSSGVSGIVHL